MAGWIGVDLDGTLAHFDRWRGPRHIGLPIPAMAKRVHDWHTKGVEVRIFTARASRSELIPDVEKWLQRHGFPPLAITNQKDFGMVELWDDRAIQVLYNTGKAVRPNRLEDTEKAALFDPDAEVYADDEPAKDLEPTREEISDFKRGIRASNENSSESLGDLMDALDEGEYTPGDTQTDWDNTNAQPVEHKKPVAPVAATSIPSFDLPADPTGFVTSTIDTDDLVKPKLSLVEVEINVEVKKEKEGERSGNLDDTQEFEPQGSGDISFAPLPEEALAKTITKPTATTSTETPVLDICLDEPPAGLEFLEPLGKPSATKVYTTGSNSPLALDLNALDDDLGDDFPAFKVDRR